MGCWVLIVSLTDSTEGQIIVWTCPWGTVTARLIEMERFTLKIEAPFPGWGPGLYKKRKWVEHKHSSSASCLRVWRGSWFRLLPSWPLCCDGPQPCTVSWNRFSPQTPNLLLLSGCFITATRAWYTACLRATCSFLARKGMRKLPGRCCSPETDLELTRHGYNVRGLVRTDPNNHCRTVGKREGEGSVQQVSATGSQA